MSRAESEPQLPRDGDEETQIGSDCDHIKHDNVPIGLMDKLYRKVDDKLLKGFTPVYFVQVMATGISSTILYNFPFPANWLKICSYIIWSYGILLFIVGNGLLMVSCIKYRHHIIQLHTNPMLAPAMGCYAMAYVSLINQLHNIVGKSWIIGILVLWWISVVLCIHTSLIFFFTFLAKSKSGTKFSVDKFSGMLLLPIVALMVDSSAGQLIAMDLPTLQLQVTVILFCYIMWAIALAMSFIILTLIFYKYVVYKLPNTTEVFTTFIPIGFLGQGAFSILQFGKNMHQLILDHQDVINDLPITTTSDFAMIMANGILIMSSLTGLFLFSFGYFNTFIAIISVLTKIFTTTPNPKHVVHNKGWLRIFNGLIKYNKGFWAMTFPLGTMAISNALFGELFHLLTFKVIGAIYGVACIAITIGCIIGSFYHLCRDVKSCTSSI